MRGSVETASEPGDQSEPSDDPDAGALCNPVPRVGRIHREKPWKYILVSSRVNSSNPVFYQLRIPCRILSFSLASSPRLGWQSFPPRGECRCDESQVFSTLHQISPGPVLPYPRVMALLENVIRSFQPRMMLLPSHPPSPQIRSFRLSSASGGASRNHSATSLAAGWHVADRHGVNWNLTWFIYQ